MDMMLALFNHHCIKAYQSHHFLFLWYLCVPGTHLLLVGWPCCSRLDSPTCRWVAGGPAGATAPRDPHPAYKGWAAEAHSSRGRGGGWGCETSLASPSQTCGHACGHFIGRSRFHSHAPHRVKGLHSFHLLPACSLPHPLLSPPSASVSCSASFHPPSFPFSPSSSSSCCSSFLASSFWAVWSGEQAMLHEPLSTWHCVGTWFMLT